MNPSIIFTLVTVAGLTSGAPQYGSGVQPPPSRPAKQVGGSTTSVQCRTEYTTIWDTQYQEKETQECVTKYDNVCKTVFERQCQPTTRQECNTIYEKKCTTVYKNVCVDKYKTEYEPYTETECSTQYKEDCEYQWEGHGNNKVWVPIPGTCKNNPYDECKEVTKTKERQVAYPVCQDVPEQSCRDVPRQVCRDVPDQVCRNQPLEQCNQVPRQECHSVHKKFPVRISKSVPKKVCDGGYGSTGSTAASRPEIFDVRGSTNSESQKIVFA